MKKIKTIRFSFVLCVTFLIISSTYIFAQTGTLNGQITDLKSNQPLPFVDVYTKDKTASVVADVNGNYTLELEAGIHTIIYNSIGYDQHEQQIEITAGKVKTLDVQMTIAEYAVPEIMVSVSKYDMRYEEVSSSVEILKPNIIENKAATQLSDALEQVPGLTIVDEEPQIRGSSGYSFGAGSRVMVLVDDLPVLSGDAGRPSWDFIPIENIEQVEVIKGASSVLYGSAALNGVINVRTAYPTSTPKTMFTFNTGIWDSPKLLDHPSIEDRDQAKWWDEDLPFYTSISFLRSHRTSEYFSYTLGGNAHMERGYLGPAPQDSLQQMHDDLNPGSFKHRARLNFTTNIRAKNVRGLSYGINGNMMYDRFTDILIWENDTSGLYRSAQGATTITRRPQFSIDPFVSYFDNSGNNFSLNTRIYYLNNQNDNDQQNASTFYYGEFRYMKNFQTIPDFTLSTGAMVQHTIGTSELFSGGEADQVEREQTNYALYAQLDKKFWDRVNLTLGGRWEYFIEDTISVSRPIFRAGISGRAAQATYLRASFGQGFRFPTIAEKYISTEVGGFSITPNPDLKPEDSWSAEIGIKQGIRIRNFMGYVDVAGFMNYYENYIEFIAAQWLELPAPNFGMALKSVNTGNARVTGLDVSMLGQGKLSDDLELNLLLGYTWSKPVALNPDSCFAFDRNGNCVSYISSSSDTANSILKYRYEHLVKADLELIYKRFSTGVSYRMYSRMQNVDNIFLVLNIGNARGFLERHDGLMHVVDWRIGYHVTTHSKVSFVINNLLNREYALRPLVISPPRSFAFQYTLRI